MRHQKKGRKLNRTASHRKALFSNLAASLVIHKKIRTTEAKGKELRTYVERLVTYAKRGDLHGRRLIQKKLAGKRGKEVANILDSIMVAKINVKELTLLQRDELKKRIHIAGFGENKPQFDVKLIKGDYYVFNVDSIVDYPEGPYNLSAAIDIAYQRNRRVVINIIERGI